MSGFKDTFTKEDDNLLNYDDTAFYYFASSLVFVIVVPLTYSVIKNFLFGKNSNAKEFPKFAADGTEFRYCKSSAMEKKIEDARREARKTTTNGTVKFSLKLVALAMVWAGLFYLTTYCASQKEIVSFDPFAILQVETEAETSEIKKAYRKLSLVYHPDKNQGDPVAQSKFIQITKAYEALTDETARTNYEKYGNPDGPTASKVGVGLPSFLLEKGNHVIILSLFFFMLLIFVPAVGICYYRKVKDYMPSGIMVETHNLYNCPNKNYSPCPITDGQRLKDMPELFAYSAEARKIPVRISPQYEKALKDLKRDVDYKEKEGKKGRQLNYQQQLVQKNTILLQAHMERLHDSMTPVMREEVDLLLKHSMKVTQEMMDIVKEKSVLSIIYPHAQLGTTWLGTAQAIISFRRCLVQALKSGDKECELMQIPHFTDEVLKHCKKGKQSKQVSGLSDWLSRAPEDRKGLRDMDSDKILDMEAFCNHISQVELKATIGVEGEDDILDTKESGTGPQQSTIICMGDIATITVGLTRSNMEKGQAMGPAHAPYFPEPKFEEWWLFVTGGGSQAGDQKIYAMEKIRDPSWYVEAKLQIQVEERLVPKLGKHKFEVHAFCDSYLGVDQKVSLDFTVIKPEDIDRQEFVHQEDQDLDLQPTLFQQMMGGQQQDDSEEEEEDDDDEEDKEKKAKKKEQIKKREKTKEEESSDDEDEKDDKDEEAEDEEKTEETKKASPKKDDKVKPKKGEKKTDTKDDDSSESSDDDDDDSDDDKKLSKKSGPCSGCAVS